MFGPEAVEVGRGDADDLHGVDRRHVGGARSAVDDGDLAERIARSGEADAQLPPLARIDRDAKPCRAPRHRACRPDRRAGRAPGPGRGSARGPPWRRRQSVASSRPAKREQSASARTSALPSPLLVRLPASSIRPAADSSGGRGRSRRDRTAEARADRTARAPGWLVLPGSVVLEARIHMHRRMRIDMHRGVEVIREARVRAGPPRRRRAGGRWPDARERRLARAGGREGGLQTIEGDAPAVRTEAEGRDDRGRQLLRQLRIVALLPGLRPCWRRAPSAGRLSRSLSPARTSAPGPVRRP